MPGPTTKSRDDLGHDQGGIRDLMLQHQKAVDDLETLRLKINAVITAAATSLAAVAAVPAQAALTAGKVGDLNGNALT